IGTQPPAEPDETQPWPTHPVLFEVSTAHEEGGERSYLATTTGFRVDADGAVDGLVVARTQYRDGARMPPPGTETVLPAALVLIAIDFTDTLLERSLDAPGADLTSRRTVVQGADWATSAPGVCTAGDCARGQSHSVWAIVEGRTCAAAVDAHLTGSTT